MTKSFKIKLAVVMGGPSSEHIVSLNTGKNILENLDRNKYDIVAIEITKDGKWRKDGKILTIEEALKNIDVVFNAMHGEFGEDGTFQGLLESFRIPYNGAGVLASALGMNKFVSRLLFREFGLKTPPAIFVEAVDKEEALNSVQEAVKKLKLPAVVKPNSRGSSVGVSIIRDIKQIEAAVAEAFKFDKQLLVEKFLAGREFTCGVLEMANGDILALPVTEIIPKNNHEFFDYKAKYNESCCDEVTPADISQKLAMEIQENAILAHKAIGCRNYSRSDFIVSSNEIYILEINTLPGMTKNSLLPKAAKAAGIEFKELLDTIIGRAISSRKN